LFDNFFKFYRLWLKLSRQREEIEFDLLTKSWLLREDEKQTKGKISQSVFFINSINFPLSQQTKK
jgi:hypothetical protein